MNAVFFEANDDSITKRVHDARRKALKHNSAYPEVELFGKEAHYSDVKVAYVQTKAFGLFSGMGHGSASKFTGQWESVLYDRYDTQSTNYTVKGTVVHLYSCYCGQQLGPYLVNLGAKAFIGYTNPVEVPSSQSVVDEFVKVAATIDRSILDGDSHTTTKAKADTEFQSVEGRLLASAVATSRDVARFRLNNRSMVGPWTDRQYGYY